MLELVPEAAIAVDAAGVIAGANARAATLAGDADLVGRPMDAVLVGPSEVRRSDGSLVGVGVQIAPLRAQEQAYVIFLLKALPASEQTHRDALELIAEGAPASEIFASIARDAARSLGARVFVALIGPDRRLHVTTEADKEHASLIEGAPVDRAATPWTAAAQSGAPVVIDNLATDTRARGVRHALVGSKARGCAVYPFRAGDGVDGVVVAMFSAAGRARSADADAVLRRAATTAAVAMRASRADERAQTATERYEMLSELTADFVYSARVHSGGVAEVEWTAGALERITGYTSEEFESTGGWRGICHPDDRAIHEGRAERIAAGEADISEFRILTRSGRVRWVRAYTRPIVDERGLKVHGVARDITDIREAEESRNTFLNTASHELRTPLTVIQGFVSLLGDPRIDEETEREAVEAIERRSQQLAWIVERILLSSRIESGRLYVERQEVDVDAILERRAAAFRSVTKRRIRVTDGTAGARAWADAAGLASVIDQLLDNAVKYSDERTDVRVSARADDDHVWISVEDDGRGMNDAELARCFETFYRSESEDVRHFGGTGVGLSIVRSLVAAMGGFARAESQFGSGSRFTVCVPRCR